MIKAYLLVGALAGWTFIVWSTAIAVNQVDGLHQQIKSYKKNDQINVELVGKLSADKLQLEELTLDVVKNITIDVPACVVPGSVGGLLNKASER